MKNRLMRLMSAAFPVQFLIVGVQKGGTTALDRYLRAHRALCLPFRKECHFFDDDRYFPDGQPVRTGAYHAMFPRGWGRIPGETTPSYLYCSGAMPRVAAYHPGMKVIVLLRNPVERAFSHWHMEYIRGFEPLRFEDALAAEAERLAIHPEHPVFSYTDRGYYARQLRHMWTYIPREQSLVMRSDALRKMPGETMETVCRFLGVAPLPAKRICAEPVFAQDYQYELPDACRQQLREQFAPSIHELEKLLGWDCADWLEG